MERALSGELHSNVVINSNVVRNLPVRGNTRLSRTPRIVVGHHGDHGRNGGHIEPVPVNAFSQSAKGIQLHDLLVTGASRKFLILSFNGAICDLVATNCRALVFAGDIVLGRHISLLKPAYVCLAAFLCF
jgi:hypothetical protein